MGRRNIRQVVWICECEQFNAAHLSDKGMNFTCSAMLCSQIIGQLTPAEASENLPIPVFPAQLS